ncbi:hypothetical protein ACFOZ0_22255 [Streptomyces yaanensis]|uniref:Integral membrane protein n=1 Tax=Streptomyces yaanensis TaxID=1142239 RepID=A0ABV7SG69_9ACTN|nr:hypothetical protein [Streptomyces sp. CGMCC 4.7035]WNB97451.1 hypothetical protein Q2K21_04835 [Streptomyces sp. CGMCC 4.7035]
MGRPVLVVVGLLAVGAALTWYAGAHLAYATGLAGTPGHFRVESCYWRHFAGHRYPHCSGVFRSSDGAVVDPDATIDTHLPVGDTFAMQRTTSGGYEQMGIASSCGWLALSLLGLMVLLLGILVVSTKAGERRAPRPLRVLLGWLGAVMLLSALIGGVAGMTEAF